MRGHDGLTTEQAEARDLRLQGDALVRVWARILSRRGTNRGRGFSGTGEGREALACRNGGYLSGKQLTFSIDPPVIRQGEPSVHAAAPRTVSSTTWISLPPPPVRLL